MPAPCSFDYAVLRAVPCIERGEFVNAGVILHAPSADFLGARVALDDARVHALSPGADVDALRRALEIHAWIAVGDPRGGPIAKLPRSERFHWLVAPRSTIVQTSPVHAGLCDDPQATLDRLLGALVLTAP